MSLFKIFGEKTESWLEGYVNDVIGIVAIDADGKLVYINDIAQEILADLIGKSRLPRGLIGTPLDKILRKPLSQTVIGRTLLSGVEVRGQLVAFGARRCMVTTRLIRDRESNPIGCIQYILEVETPRSEDQLHVSQSFTRSLADKLGYTSTEWIDNISFEHFLQLVRCLCNTEHTVPITDYCPYKFYCAFHPRYGWDSLDRRSYLRVPIELRVEVHLLELAFGQPVPGHIQDKAIPGTTFNLSPRGIGLKCAVKIPLNSIIRIEVDNEDKPFTCNGEVVWQRQDKDGNWLSGVSFVSVSSQTQSVIIGLVNKQQLRLWGKSAPRSRLLPGTGLIGPDAKYSIATLRNLLKAKSEALFQHSLRVASAAEVLGTALNLTDKQLMLLNYAALLHDLGWLELDVSMLRKRNSLTPEEKAKALLHCSSGANLVKAVPALEALAPIILYHHEHYDGSGYPGKLKGERIPLLSRIICVVDAVDSMLYPFSGREMRVEQVIDVLSQEAGGKYDPQIVEKCIELLRDDSLMSAV